jgi:hypothetical protein
MDPQHCPAIPYLYITVHIFLLLDIQVHKISKAFLYRYQWSATLIECSIIIADSLCGRPLVTSPGSRVEGSNTDSGITRQVDVERGILRQVEVERGILRYPGKVALSAQDRLAVSGRT